ncbi:predicted protein [Micromonas commoda]|uniref:SUI1 domain-containing protein n=1 Tax=Micromonas commoda (strain RCC299 / NOUM17 / CCMP2709) TaxID=296587 RepID=C1EBV3_MICCC|nr:predicted protein [Micromonas commoda]ACO65479.1 predicted protein [Micromonas commoda]|eukprot:XP_002504221.1 predicted protein [Micromonas commoda]
MFRKPLPTTGAHKLGGSDEKKLRKQIVAAFPCAGEDDAMALVPKKAELSLQKLAAPSRTQIYVGDGQPVFYDTSGKGDLFPTVFALWRAPGMLGEPVSFGRGRLFAVVVPGNPAPIAVGEAEMSSAEVRDAGGAGGKGRFLKILTTYRDALWDYAASHASRPQLVPNEGFLEKGVVPLGSAAHDDAEDVEEDDVEDDVEVDEEVDEEASGKGVGDVNDAVAGLSIDAEAADEGADEGVDEDVDEGSGVVADQTPHQLTVAEMDALIESAVLQALSRDKTVTDKSLPMLGTAFWSRHVNPCRPAGAPPLDIKRSSHKKMSALLRHVHKMGWATCKEDKRTKETAVTAIVRSHPDLRNHVPHETAADADAGAAAAAGAVEGGKPQPLRLEEHYKPHVNLTRVLEAIDAPTDALYTGPEARELVVKYVAVKALDAGKSVTLDPQLCDALFKGVLKKGDAFPTHMSKSDVTKAWLNRFHPQTAVVRGGTRSVKKGALQPVRVESDRRGGDRRITRVTGTEAYLIDPEELARTLGSKLATACATGELEGIKNVGKREVVAQGNAVEKVARILAEWYGVPSRFIDTADKLKGKGKNK